MPIDRDALSELHRLVGRFRISDRSLRSLHHTVEEALRNGTLSDAVTSRYLEAIRRYFSAFDREARVTLRDVDRRLEALRQVEFNLLAERGVLVRRIEETQAVLAALHETGETTRS
jgi:hypothetical protein